MKKIICLFLACCISFTVLVLPVSADNNIIEQNTAKYYAFLFDLITQYKNNEIGLDTLLTESYENYMEVGSDNLAQSFLNLADIIDSIGNFGIDVSGDWYEWNYQMGGGGSGGNRDDSILNGFSCAVFQYNSKGQKILAMYGSNGTLKEYKAGVFTANMSFDVYYTYNGSTGDITSTLHNGSKSFDYDTSLTPRVWVLYGSWDATMLDDEAVPDGVITELPEKEIPNYDDDSVSDDDLIDFLEDLLQDLMLQFPDLTNVEGLLRAILAKLGNLDSDNDNELLCSILTAIQALKSSDNPETTEDLSKCLEDIKDDLVFNDGENSVTLAEQLNALVENQIKLSDISIDESLYNQRFELIQTKLLGKFSFISEMKNFIDYALDAYSSTTSPNISFAIFGNSYNIDFSAFDDSIDLIRFCIAAFCYLSFAFVTFRKIPSYINGGDNT